MSTEQIYSELLVMQKEDFDNLKSYLHLQEPKGYFLWLREDENVTEFKVGQRTFIMQAEIRPYARYISYKTYQVVMNMQDYPKNELKYIPALNIHTNFSRLRTFLEEKTFKIPAKIGPPVEFKRKKIEVNEFGKSYVDQVEEYLFENDNY